jgi:hypothetical protein
MSASQSDRFPPLSGFLLPDNGETERGVKTIEIERGLKTKFNAPLRGIIEYRKNIETQKGNFSAIASLAFYWRQKSIGTEPFIFTFLKPFTAIC